MIEIIQDAAGIEGVDMVLEFSSGVPAIGRSFEMLNTEGRVSPASFYAEPLQLDFSNSAIRKCATMLRVPAGASLRLEND